MEKRTIKAAREALADWLPEQSEEINRLAETLPLRRDALTMLAYIRDNKVTGTQGAGNLPLKTISALNELLVKPQPLEQTIGAHTYRVRNEEEHGQLHFLRILGEVGGLLKTGSARRWQLSKEGEKFLAAEPLLQTAYLLAVWWYRVNWLIAYSYTGMGDRLPPMFTLTTLESLLSLPVGREIKFEDYADKLIRATGLKWGVTDPDIAKIALHGSINRMVIAILHNFGVLTTRYEEEPLGKGTVNKLAAFEITPLGGALLRSLVFWDR